MKKARKAEPEDDLRAEYDAAVFSGGSRGKYAKRFHQGTNLVLLEPDIAAAFPSHAAVNSALRLLIDLARATAEDGSKKGRK